MAVVRRQHQASQLGRERLHVYRVSGPTSWLVSRDLRQSWNHGPTGSITFPTQSNSMTKSPWRSSTQLDSSEIQYLLSHPNYHYRTHKSPQLASILSQMNTIQNLLNQISLRQIYIYFLKLSSHPSIRFRVFLLQVFWKRTVCMYMCIYIYRVSQEEWTKLRENVPYVKLYRYNPKHLYPKLNGCGDNGQRSLRLWQLLHTYWLPNTY